MNESFQGKQRLFWLMLTLEPWASLFRMEIECKGVHFYECVLWLGSYLASGDVGLES